MGSTPTCHEPASAPKNTNVVLAFVHTAKEPEQQVERLAGAEVAFRHATECFPDDSLGWRYFGEIALKRGDVESAIRRLQKAIDLARRRLPKRLPTRPAANHDDWRDYERGLAGLVTALSRAGRHDEARETCERFRRDGADAPTVGYLLAFVHLQAGRWKLAPRCRRAVTPDLAVHELRRRLRRRRAPRAR